MSDLETIGVILVLIVVAVVVIGLIAAGGGSGKNNQITAAPAQLANPAAPAQKPKLAKAPPVAVPLFVPAPPARPALPLHELFIPLGATVDAQLASSPKSRVKIDLAATIATPTFTAGDGPVQGLRCFRTGGIWTTCTCDRCKERRKNINA